MVTVVNNPGATERVVESDSGAGWAVAVIVLLAVLGVGAYIWTHRTAAPVQQAPGANIQVTLPSAGTQPADNSGSSNGDGTQANPAQ